MFKDHLFCLLIIILGNKKELEHCGVFILLHNSLYIMFDVPWRDFLESLLQMDSFRKKKGGNEKKKN